MRGDGGERVKETNQGSQWPKDVRKNERLKVMTRKMKVKRRRRKKKKR